MKKVAVKKRNRPMRLNVSTIKSDMTNYSQYIAGNSTLTICQKETLLNYYNLLNHIISPTNSNFQIQTLFDYIQSIDSMEQHSRLYILIQFFASSGATTHKIMDMLIGGNISDREIIDLINITRETPAPRSKFNKCNKWNYAIQSLSKSYILRFDIASPQINKMKYLDIGCGTASKTVLFTKYMGFLPSNVHCTDIQSWGPYGENKLKIPFAFEYIKDGYLNYNDNSFDFITCIFTLHHIKEMEAFIREIYRVMKPGGRLMIIEHSAYTDCDKLLIHIQHLLYSGIYDGRIDYIENPDYINLFNMYEWEFIMARNNLISTEKNIVVFNSEFNVSYENIFYGIYTKQ